METKTNKQQINQIKEIMTICQMINSLTEQQGRFREI